MPLDPLRSLPISTTRAIRADQDTLLRAVSVLLPGSTRRAPTPISLGEASSVTLLHGFDRAGVAVRDALTTMLHAEGVAVHVLAPEPALGEIHPSPRTSLVIAASPAVATAAQRCACLWISPVTPTEDVPGKMIRSRAVPSVADRGRISCRQRVVRPTARPRWSAGSGLRRTSGKAGIGSAAQCAETDALSSSESVPEIDRGRLWASTHAGHPRPASASA